MNNSVREAIVGSWVGGCAIEQRWTYLEAHFTAEALSTTGTIDIRFEGEMGLEINQVHFDLPRVQFALSRAGGTWVFDGLHTDGLISGTVTAAQEQRAFQLLAVAEVDSALYDTYVGSYQLQPDRIISIASAAINSNRIGLSRSRIFGVKLGVSIQSMRIWLLDGSAHSSQHRRPPLWLGRRS
jgi:hypothetical protein